jgi:putative ABC transport system substrate-binding protein
MKRRELLKVLGGAVGWPLAVAAQERRRRPRIGVLLAGPPAAFANRIADLRRGLEEHGYAEPERLELIFRYSETEPDRLPALARELVADDVDMIVTSATPGVRAAMAATSTIPIVIAAAADVVGSGLVASLARPGGNVTGLTLLIPDLAGKQLELIREFVPGLTRVGALRGQGEGAQAFETIRAAAAAYGIEPHFEDMDSYAGIASAFARMRDARCQAVILVDGPALNSARETVAENALIHRMPTVSTLRLFVDAGSLVAYGPNLGMMWRRAAYYVDRILKGASPRELPVEQPSAFELVINQKTAGLLGLTLSGALLARADEVIE